jgi:hypothetical protein
MSVVDSDCTIHCGSCGEASPAMDWMSTPLNGELPRGVYQCPQCKRAFERKLNTNQRIFKSIVCEQVPTTL